jgi:predicted amidohydrolase
LQLEALGLARAEEALERALSMVDRAGQSQPDLMVLPECTYPAYYLQSVESYYQADLRPHEEVVRLFGERAKVHQCHLVVGLAQPAESGRLLNSAYLFNPQGEIVGTYAKSFLWHFDQYWFDPGQQFPAFDLPFGRTGLFVCADGRMPEVVRALGLERSRLLVDATAWTTTGGDRATLTNPQFEYMMPVRAIENGAWVVVANKVGVEAESVVYCGRSCMVAPDGRHVAQASPDREEILLAQIDLAEAAGPPVRRRPGCYTALTEPTEKLPVTRLLAESFVPAETVVRVGVLQLKPYDSAEAFMARVTTLTETLVRQEAKFVVLPGVPRHKFDSPAYQAEQTLAPLQALSQRLGCGLACPLIALDNDGRRTPTVYLVDRGELLGLYRQTHFTDDDIALYGAGEELPVFETRFGRVGVMLNPEGLLPEVPRTLMLQGADLIVWPSHSAPYPLRTIARSRADENKVFVALATPLEEDTAPQTALINPAGGFLAAALPDIEQGIAGQVAWALTRYKEMAPNTHVVFNRQPHVYGRLVG